MKNILHTTIVLLLFLFSSISVFGQSVTFNFQSEIDNFSTSIAEINGNLKIGPSEDIVDLSPLANIENINGNLTIIGNENLTNLDGLDIDVVDKYLNIFNNERLENLEGLQSIKSITIGLSIVNNDALISMSGIRNIDFEGFLSVNASPNLLEIEGLNNFIAKDYIAIINNTKISHLDALNNLTRVEGTLNVSKNDNLKNIDGLINVQYIDGSLILKKNTILENIDGLVNVGTISQNLSIIENDAITNINGLKNLDSLGQGFEIMDNDGLTNIDGLENLTFVIGTVDISYNKSLTNLKGLENVKFIWGNFKVYQNDILTNCCAVQELVKNRIQTVHRDIIISGNPSECSTVDEVSKYLCHLFFTTETNHPCKLYEDGVINIKVWSYSDLPLNYYWERHEDGLTGMGTSSVDVFSIENLGVGTYTISVIDPSLDTVVVSDIVLSSTAFPRLELDKIVKINTSVNSDNGEISVYIQGGTPPYSYFWMGVTSGNLESTTQKYFTLDSLRKGHYVITVKDSNEEVLFFEIDLVNDDIPLLICNSPLDVVFLVDVSSSVKIIEYEESKEFFVNLSKSINLGSNPDSSRVAIIEWSSQNEQELKIPITGDLSEICEYSNSDRSFGGSTSPGPALSFGKEYLDGVARPQAQKVIVLSTDGLQLNTSLIDSANIYKEEGILIHTIAIDQAFLEYQPFHILREMSSVNIPTSGAPSYAELDSDVIDYFVNILLCPVGPGTTTVDTFVRDGSVDILDIDLIGSCPNLDSVTVELELTASGDLSLPPGVPVSFYLFDPLLLGSSYISSWMLPCEILAGDSEVFYVTLPIASPTLLFAALNVDSTALLPLVFPTTNLLESTYENNIDSMGICSFNRPTLVTNKYTTTPYPDCDTLINYVIDVCNISEYDATDVSIVDEVPDGFTLIASSFTDNNCGLQNGALFDIPIGCCISFMLTYNVSNAVEGIYNNQGVDITGPENHKIFNFDAVSNDAEDVVIDGSIFCENIQFIKSVNLSTSCDQSVLTYTFTIENNSNLFITDLEFEDILTPPVTWLSPPYNIDGLVLSDVTIVNSLAASVIEIAPNTTGSFSIDVDLGVWGSADSLKNSALFVNVPNFENDTLISAISNQVSTLVTPIVLIDIAISDTIAIESDELTVDLSPLIDGAIDIMWSTQGDGSFSNNNSASVVYTLGNQDTSNFGVLLTVIAENECDIDSTSVFIKILECPLSQEDFETTSNCAVLSNGEIPEYTVTLPVDSEVSVFEIFPDVESETTITESAVIIENLPPGIYTFELNETCELEIVLTDCRDCIDYASVFFPGADISTAIGSTDIHDITFGPVYTCDSDQSLLADILLEYSFKIYNRWGEEVFSTNDPLQKWDGKKDQSYVPSEAYIYVATYYKDLDRDGVPDEQTEKILDKGDITVIR